MATEVQIAGTQARAKIRSPWAPALLPIPTIGIYYFVWYYKINRELRDLGVAHGRQDELGESPGKSLLAVTLGALIIVPAILSLIHTGQRIQVAQRLAGRDQQLSGWLSLVLYIVISPAMFAYWQSELNKVWEGMGEPPRVEATAADTSLGPGPTTPTNVLPEPPGGGGQPGSAATPAGGTGPLDPTGPGGETPPPTTPPPENEPPA